MPPIKRCASSPVLSASSAHPRSQFRSHARRRRRGLPKSVPAAQERIVALWQEAHRLLQGPRAPGGALTTRLGCTDLQDRDFSPLVGEFLYPTRDLWYILTLSAPQQALLLLHQPLDIDILQYYLDLLPAGDVATRLRRIGRLYPVYTPRQQMGATHAPLSEQVLRSPQTLAAARRVIQFETARGSRAEGLSVFQGTARGRQTADALGIPWLAPEASQMAHGTKHGSRQVFAQAAVAHPRGTPQAVYSVPELAQALAALCQEAPDVESWMIKLSDGCASGSGNAVLHMEALRHAPITAGGVEGHLQNLRPTCNLSASAYLAQVAARGAIVEQYLGANAKSPSVQAHIHADATVEILSSHEQIMDQETGQIYKGCAFPANDTYRQHLVDNTAKIGAILRDAGVRGFFGVDYLAVGAPGQQAVYALEINLRESGATHPLMQMRLLTAGAYDAAGHWRDGCGQIKYYVSTDNLSHAHYKGLRPCHVIDAVQDAGLAFRGKDEAGTPQATHYTGVVLHLLPCLRDFGKLGAVCIANSPDEAQAQMQRLVECLDRLAAKRRDLSQRVLS